MGKIIRKSQSGLKICVVTGIPPLNLLVVKFIQVLEPIVDELVLITGNYPEKDVFSSKINLINIVPDNKKQCLLIRIPKFIFLQLKFVWHLVKNLQKTKIVIFFLEGGSFLLPMLVAKIVRKKTIIVLTHSSSQITKQLYKNKIIPFIMSILETLNRQFANRLVVYSENICCQFGLEKYRNKIIIAHEHFIDFNLFKIKIPLCKRKKCVGYIGRLCREKGVLNFTEAIYLLNKEENEIFFYIIGDGELREEIKEILDQKEIGKRVHFSGWIQHEQLPVYLNKMKLLVIPSYTEGLVNVMLEAMACGTPVLATAVGAIPDVIKEGKTGFLLKDNSPATIAKGITRALNHPNLEQIAANARGLVEQEYTFEAAVERYRKIFEEVLA